MTEPGLLCVHAHPDDEALWTGGLLARYAEAGVRTGVVTCTWRQGTRRVTELARSLSILEAGRPRLLGYADSAPDSGEPGKGMFRTADFDEAVGAVVAHIREFRPTVVVTYDGYGGYGHPDHVRAHRVTVAAVEAAAHDQLFPDAGKPWQVQALYLGSVPRTAVRALWHVVFGSEPEPDQVLPGVPDEQITTELDVLPWFRQKWDALWSHESEAERGAGPAMFSGLPDEQCRQLLGTEWYMRRPLTSSPQPAPRDHLPELA